MSVQLGGFNFRNNEIWFIADRQNQSKVSGRLTINGKLKSFIELKNLIPNKVKDHKVLSNLDSGLDYIRFNFPNLSKESQRNPQYYPYYLVFYHGKLAFMGKIFSGNFTRMYNEHIDNTWFIGEMKNGLKSGFGELRTSEFYYIGNFSCNHFSGKGKLLKDRCQYKGNFVQSKLQGQVTVKKGVKKHKEYYNNGILQSNHPSSSKPREPQVAISTFGYHKNMKKVKENGIDCLILKGGQKIPLINAQVWIDYELSLSSNNFHESLDDQNSAKKKILFANGETYDGSVNEHNKLHGFGKYSYLNGMMYIGEFNNGQKHGIGTLLQHSQKLIKGHWENDVLHGKACLFEQGFSIRCIFSNGKIFHVVSVSDFD